MRAVSTEGGMTLLVDEPGRSVLKSRPGILVGRNPFGLEEKRPSRAEPLQDVVEPRRDRDELGLCGAVEIGSAIADRPLK